MDQEDEERVPRYDREDVSPTSNRELKGWYFTGLAAEVYAVCGVGSFGPVTLEQLARESGVLRSDGKTPCIQPKTASSALLQGAAKLLARADESSGGGGECIVHPFGIATSSASFAMYTFSLAVFTQAVVLVSFSPFADYGTYRKRLLVIFAYTGAIATALFLFIWSQLYVFGAVLVIVGVVCLGSSFVLLNSYLPLLAANHPSVRSTASNGRPQLSADGNTELRGTFAKVDASATSPELRLSTKISAIGVGLGYAAAVSIQILSIVLLVLLKKANFSSESTPLRCVLLLVGVSWAALSLPGALWLRARPGPALRITAPWRTRMPQWIQYLAFAWGSLWSTVRTAAKLRQTWVFLIAWFLLSDAIATVSGTAILFARTELHMSTIPIALLSITATLSGIAGAFLWPKISRRLNLDTRTTILACMVLMEIIPIYGLIGFLPFIKSWGVGGLQQAWEIYPLGFVHGFVMGGLSSYCRAFYGEIIPPGSEAAFYALYAITDKGSSAVGPAIVGAIVDRIGTIRPAFGFLAILIALPMPLIWYVNVAKGREEAVALSKLLGYRGGEGILMEDFEEDNEDAEGLLAGSDEEDR